MPNDLATMKTALATQLRDTTNATWTAAELGDLLTWATSMVFQDRPRSVTESVTLADDDDQYTLSTVQDVFRVDILDADGVLFMSVPTGAWELWSDGQSDSPTLYINPRYARTGWTLRVHGYAPYDLSTNYPPDRMVPLLLAVARAEALRRELGRRARFENWAQSNPINNTSVNEMTQMLNEADAEAERLRRQLRIIHKPKPGRV